MEANNVAINFTPMTCLPLIWKLFIGVIKDQIYEYLDRQKLLPLEQRGCKKEPSGPNDLRYIDRAVIAEVKSMEKNLAMTLINYKNTYNTVPRSWIKDTLSQLWKSPYIFGLI